jgi:hypothetical protein
MCTGTPYLAIHGFAGTGGAMKMGGVCDVYQVNIGVLVNMIEFLIRISFVSLFCTYLFSAPLTSAWGCTSSHPPFPDRRF